MNPAPSPLRPALAIMLAAVALLAVIWLLSERPPGIVPSPAPLPLPDPPVPPAPPVPPLPVQ